MKLSWIAWWIVSLFWIITFIAMSVFIWIRDVDASGITQTFEAKLAAFIVLAIFYIIPLVIQLIWMIINIVVAQRKAPTDALK
ncbi:DUF3923 family protein [Staphylococcus caledonicus]|uniref:DUF3923 family protein n=1 Tax=Staphylococcus caledonicus TaxID=2741333 RepID=UPI0018E44C2E|nr:DUF3923 family protein [Staphylococcus caledonicus]MBI5973576.1 DUF3923 family protein [Staphylococcus caledonicus]